MRRRDQLTLKRDAARKRAARALLRSDPERWSEHLRKEREREARLRVTNPDRIARVRRWSIQKARVRGSFAGWFWMSEGCGVAGRLKRLARVCAWAGLGAKRSSQEELAAGWDAHERWLASLDSSD